MPVQTKTVLKSYFNDGDVPSESDYIDLIDTMGVGDMQKSVYDTDDDGKVESSDSADAAPWTGITGKPATYPPSTHLHDSDYFRKDASIASNYSASFVGGLSVGNITSSPTAGRLYANYLWLYASGTFYADLYVDSSWLRLCQNSPAGVNVYSPRFLRADGGLVSGALTPSAGDIQGTADGRLGGGLYVGATNVNPDTGDVYHTGDLRPVRASTTYTAYSYVPLTNPATSTSWDGDNKTTTGSPTQIDLSAAFSLPANIKAVSLVVTVRDSSSASATSGQSYLTLQSTSSSANPALVARAAGQVNNLYVDSAGVVPCDSNGDIWYNCNALGTFQAYINITGYWI